ncbi:glycoside hydrolase family 97 protein [Chitinophaga parva]|nr:glycoside hydrolase family 97 protein [Chitinophaga parva]
MQALKTMAASLLLAGATAAPALAQQAYTVQSPDGHLSARIFTGPQLRYQLLRDGETLIDTSAISLQLSTGEILGKPALVRSQHKGSVQQIISAPVYKRKTVNDHYNELTLALKGDYSVVFRAYNEGVAYRFATSKKAAFDVVNEEATFNFPANDSAWVPYVRQDNPASFDAQFYNSFENTYTVAPLASLDSRRLAFLPVAVNAAGGKHIAITEADLENYPGMYVNGGHGQTLKGVFAPAPKDIEAGGHNMLQGVVKTRQPYIAHCEGARNFPWRIMAVSTQDTQLADNDLVYKLASPSRVADVSWVKPGKVAWDWWNDWNIYGVDFKAGINNDTYKYYIDFASAHHIDYVILDEGWAVNLKADLFQVIPEIDLQQLVDYGKQKGVRIILWAGYNAFNRDLEKVCRHFSEMGVAGFKVDFMDRDDQAMVNFYYQAAATAAKYRLLLDFHGAYKPTGLQRTYPNVVNFEGVHGLENMKWETNSDQVTYDVSIPYLRMLAGPMDYTQGAMRNATRGNYRAVNAEPMSQGTRCHQLAEYVIFESPLEMLCDAPTNYMAEKECTELISAVPTVWDNTMALNGEMGQYISIARQSGNYWYVGSLNNWTARNLTLDLGFLGNGHYKAEVFKDGANADRAAKDYKREIIDVPANKQLTISMAPGGGYFARIYAE